MKIIKLNKCGISFFESISLYWLDPFANYLDKPLREKLIFDFSLSFKSFHFVIDLDCYGWCIHINGKEYYNKNRWKNKLHKKSTYIINPKCKICGGDVPHSILNGDYSLLICSKGCFDKYEIIEINNFGENGI